MEYKIRKATIEDLKEVDRLQQQVVIHEKKFNKFTRPEGIVRYNTVEDIKKLLSSEDAFVLLIEIHGELIGTCYGCIKKVDGDWSKHTHTGWIHSVYVDTNHRNQHLGKRMLEELIKWFKEKEVKDIRLEVYPNNLPAVKLYEQLGFKTYLLHMSYDS